MVNLYWIIFLIITFITALRSSCYKVMFIRFSGILYIDTILSCICLQMEFKDKETKWEWYLFVNTFINIFLFYVTLIA